MHDELDQAVLVSLQTRKLLILGARVCELVAGRFNPGRLANESVGSFKDHDADSGGQPEHAARNQHVRRPNPGLLQ